MSNVIKSVTGWNTIYKYLEESKNFISVRYRSGDNRIISKDANSRNVNWYSIGNDEILTITINKYLRLLDKDYLDEFNRQLISFHPGNKVIVAYDAWGGLFCIGNGDFTGQRENVWYFSPDTLDWEDLGINYLQFVSWTCSEDINSFYEAFSWEGLELYLDKITEDEAILIYPFLWSEECELVTASKKIVPFLELVKINDEFRKQMFIE